MRNAFRHADAKQVAVGVHYEDEQVRLRMRDDGKGIDPEVLSRKASEGHYGIAGMRERANIIGAKLELRSELGGGTEIELCVPASKAYATGEKQRGFEIVKEYTDHGISGARAKRPGLDDLLREARLVRFNVVLVWSCDRLARSTRHFLEVLDELNHLGIEFVSLREQIDTGGPLGRAIITIVGAVAELERSLIIEPVRAGMRRAKLEGRRLGRPPLGLDAKQVLLDRARGLSLSQIARAHRTSRTSVRRLLGAAAPKGSLQLGSQITENKPPE